jgi:hypothetical protein
MNSSETIEIQRVRFEEVSPTTLIVAFLDAQLKPLVNHLQLSIFDGYDDLDYMQFSFLTLPSGKTVTVGEYARSPEPGVDLYVDSIEQDIPELVVQSCLHLGIPRSKVRWLHPDFQEEIDEIYNNKQPQTIEKMITDQSESPNQDIIHEPIDCFYHALSIYTRQKFPEYWAMLQHNLGLAYHDRSQGDRRENLERSIVSFHNALQIHTQQEFPEKWKIDQDDLAKSRAALELLGNQKILQKS